MRRFFAIVLRELVERGNVLVVGLLLAAVPYGAGLFLPAADRAEAVRATAIVLAALFGLAVTAIVGGTMIGGDASARRLSFYLTRPVTPAALWFGKLVANSVLVAALVAAIARPFVLQDLRWLSTLLVVPVLLAVVHFGSMVLRGRGAGIAVTVGALALAVYVPYSLARAFNSAEAFYVGVAIVMMWIVAALVALFRCGVTQLRSGAWDVRAGARALQRSFAIWLLAAGAGATALYAGYVVLAPPFHGLPITTNGRGEWISVVTGHWSRLDYFRAGLLDVRTGRRIPLPGSAMAYAYIEPSADGGHVYFVGNGPIRHVAARPTPSLETLPWEGTVVAVSPHGSRIAFRNDARFMIADVPARRIVRSMRYDVHIIVRFDAGDRAHVAVHDGHTLTILLLDRDGRTLERAQVPTGIEMRLLDLRDDGAVVTKTLDELRVFGGSANLLWTLPAKSAKVDLLADGRSLVTTQSSLTVVSRDGVSRRTLALPGSFPFVAAQPSSSTLLVRHDGGCALLDLDRGVARDVGEAYPVAWDGPAASVLRRGGDLVRIDPATGAETLLFHGSPPKSPPWYLTRLR